MLKPREIFSGPILIKWHGLVAVDFNPLWKLIWTQERPQKKPHSYGLAIIT
jgi:hypothetical protein